METLPVSLTKKAFKEQARYSRYGNRATKTHGIFFDWGYGNNADSTVSGVGFKYGIIVWNCTKAEAYDAAWNVFRWGHPVDEIIHDCEVFIANTDQERQKIPLSVSYGRSNFR